MAAPDPPPPDVPPEPPADAAPDAPAAGRRPGGVPWRAVAGALTLAYVVWYAVDLTTLAVDPFLFNRVHAAADGLLPRLAFAVLFLGVLAHATEGLQRAVTDLWPRWTRRAAGLRAAGAFLTMALWVPAALAILWPTVRLWWVR